MSRRRRARALTVLPATFEGIVRKHRPNTGTATTPGQPRNTAAYSIIDDEWPSVRDLLNARLRQTSHGD